MTDPDFPVGRTVTIEWAVRQCASWAVKGLCIGMFLGFLATIAGIWLAR